jgi:methylated-DNA-[protein]-cysteine S-methyltransferase
VKSDRTLGGYAGLKEGIETKKTLLEIEGLIIQGKKVISDSPIIALNKNEQQRLI